MDADKLDFLKHRFPILLRQIPADTRPHWGKMTLQQMVEHFSESVRIASGKTAHTDIITPSSRLEKMRDFLMSDSPFKENTPNPLMSEVPAPVTNSSVHAAIQELQNEINHFAAEFEAKPVQVTRNPFFGDLNFEENVQLLYKHALHHLRQFGITISKEKTT